MTQTDLLRDRTSLETGFLPTQSVEIQSCFDDTALVTNGRKWVPDDATAYVLFRLSHSLPSVTTYGTALHPGTVAKSHRSMLHKVFNFGHLMKAYDPENIPRDRILGAIVDVEFTGEGSDTTSIPSKAEDAPGLRCVAAVHKLAEGADRIIGAQQGGRIRWEVSMEVRYRLDQSAFALKGDDGWEFIPWPDSDAGLRECYNPKKCAVDRDWNGRRPVLLMGGVNGHVQYMGVGLVQRGAERTNQVESFLASAGCSSLQASTNRFIESERRRLGIP